MPANLTQEEVKLRDEVRTFGTQHIRPVAVDYSKQGDWPRDIFKKAAKEGYIGRNLPRDVGGHDASLVETCIVAEELCRADAAIGMTIASATVGVGALARVGTKEQKEEYVRPILEGEMISGLALTEPDTGSAMSEISTIAERDGDEFVINGQKKWTSNAIVGDWVSVLCRTNKDTKKPHQGLSLLVVPTDADGFDATEIDKMGLDVHQHAVVELSDVRVPAENVVGDVGDGFKHSVAWINESRVRSAASQTGMAEGAFEIAQSYSTERSQGGQKISDYQGMRWKFADMKTKLETSRSQVYSTARLIDERDEERSSIVEQGAITKLYASEIANEVTGEAVQAMGGNGYDEDFGIAHLYRDIRSGTMIVGTSEVLRNTIGKAIFDK